MTRDMIHKEELRRMLTARTLELARAERTIKRLKERLKRKCNTVNF